MFSSGFSVRSLAHSFSFPYISLGCWSLCMLAVFLIRRASSTHVVRVGGSLLFLIAFFCMCIVILFVFLFLFVVFCVSVSCAALVLGRTHSLFRLSLFPKSVFNMSFAGCVLSFVPDLSFVTLVCVGSGALRLLLQVGYIFVHSFLFKSVPTLSVSLPFCFCSLSSIRAL